MHREMITATSAVMVPMSPGIGFLVFGAGAIVVAAVVAVVVGAVVPKKGAKGTLVVVSGGANDSIGCVHWSRNNSIRLSLGWNRQ